MTPLDYLKEKQMDIVEELKAFLRIPSISTQPEHNEDTTLAAHWLAESMRRAGLENVEVITTTRHPIIYGDWLHAEDAPTVLIYGHYDVQPAEPFELWESDPFDPTERDGFLYARGASDDKGQVFIHVKAVEAYLQTIGSLPINVKFIVEGEEESGGASLTAYIPSNIEKLSADIALVSDTAILTPDQPSLIYGLRGIAYFLLDITGPTRDLHSGGFGGPINNPLNVLGHVIAKLKDESGQVLIPHFYDKVKPLSDEERAMLAELPLSEEDVLQETGSPAIWGESEYTMIERLGARPTLDIHGIIGGYTGAGAKTVLPSTVHAKLSMRLVPDQDPDEIGQLLEDYIKTIIPDSVTAELTHLSTGPASIIDYNMPAMQAAVRAYAKIFDKEPVFMREGGSIPVVAEFQQHLGLQTVLMGFGLPGDNIHSPNERFYLQNFYRGMATSVTFLEEYGKMDK